MTARQFTRLTRLIAALDADLVSGRRYFRTRAGRLLTRLDEVVRAILEGEL